MLKNLFFLLLIGLAGIFTLNAEDLSINATSQESLQPRTLSKRYFAVVRNPRSNPGLFSVFCTVLGTLNAYESGSYAGVQVSLTKGRYHDSRVGPNWWEYFFEPILVGSDEGVRRKKISDQQLSAYGSWPIRSCTREYGNYLISKYVKLKPHIEEKVTAFIQENFGEDFIIGIHYRGTDKLIREARRIPYEIVAQNIQQVVDSLSESQRNQYKIFVATDEQAFLDYIKEQFPNLVLYTDSIRSNNHIPVHVGYYSSNYQRGEDAVLDCMLLSRCHFMIRTLSNLSFCSELFNPTMPVIVLE